MGEHRLKSRGKTQFEHLKIVPKPSFLGEIGSWFLSGFMYRFLRRTMTKIHKTIRIDEKLDKKIREIAEREDSSFTKVAEHLMEVGLTKTKETLGVTLLNNAIDRILSRHFKTLGDRLSRLLARNLIESLANRSLTLQVLAYHYDGETARAYNQKSYEQAIKSSTKRIEDLEEAIQNITKAQDDSS